MLRKSERDQPVVLGPHDPTWVTQFDEEAAKIRSILGGHCHSIYHIGSTAILNIYAKPIIDILIEVDDLFAIEQFNPAFEALGYLCMGEYGIPGRRFFWKGPIKRTHHIHLFEKGNSEIIRHLAFRDYLLAHPDVARAYSWIKRTLAEQFPTDREAYVQGKESFIRMIDYQANAVKPDRLSATDAVVLKNIIRAGRN